VEAILCTRFADTIHLESQKEFELVSPWSRTTPFFPRQEAVIHSSTIDTDTALSPAYPFRLSDPFG
jgi:hypothetical protein